MVRRLNEFSINFIYYITSYRCLYRVTMCVEVLGQLSYADDETADVIGQAWYYACCMDLMLEAGKLFSLYNFFISCRC